jgi:16S rRNA (cytosine1402-N4)-methyltransferase
VLARLDIDEVDGVLADLGVSSHQLDIADRGFSFRADGPIDMRMNPNQPVSAADLVNTWDAEALADVIWRYGEERRSRAIARAIVQDRPWHGTMALAALVARIVGRSGKKHPATRTFQALRIAVNDELGQIEALLPQAVDHLRPTGRLAVITFHSLEDRIVKRFMVHESGRDAPRDAWGNRLGNPRLARPQRSVTPAPDDPNPRSRSARLRVAVRS